MKCNQCGGELSAEGTCQQCGSHNVTIRELSKYEIDNFDGLTIDDEKPGAEENKKGSKGIYFKTFSVTTGSWLKNIALYIFLFALLCIGIVSIIPFAIILTIALIIGVIMHRSKLMLLWNWTKRFF